MSMKRELTAEQREELLGKLHGRFRRNMNRHPDLDWHPIEVKLKRHPEKLWSLHRMEESGGEPDLVGYDAESDQFHFVDCCEESPKGRRSVCYDDEALESRKEHKPKFSAIGMAAEMGIHVLNEQQYRDLQKLGKFDSKTSSWIITPPDIRSKGGALFCDYRFGHVFTYHNGAESYYAARGFRGVLTV